MPLHGQRLILAVAQEPFEHSSTNAGGTLTFGTLSPVCFDDGGEAREEQFPNNGLVWWMLRPGAAAFAEPGRLVVGNLEHAPSFRDDPTKEYYQVQRETVEPARPKDLLEVLALDSDQVRQESDIVNLNEVLQLNHPPASRVLVRWRDKVIGPLQASSRRTADTRGYAVSFSTERSDGHVLVFNSASLDALDASECIRVEREISTNAQAINHPRANHRLCSYELLLGDAWQSLQSHPHEAMVLRTYRDVLTSLAKRFFSRRRRQEFTAILKDLGENIAATGPEVGEGDLLKALQDSLGRQERTADELARSLLESGHLDAHISHLLDERGQAFIEERASSLQAEAEARVTHLRAELKRLEELRRAEEEDLNSRRSLAKEELEKELEQRRQAHDAELSRDREEVRAEREAFENERQTAAEINKVIDRFQKSSSEVVAEWVALSPLLRNVGLLGATTTSPGASSPAPTLAPGSGRTFSLPEFVLHRTQQDEQVIEAEQEFFNSFEQHVRSRGFVFRTLDLQSFHLSVKCNPITVLGGVSGTGKSSLWQLYSEVLTGTGPADRHLLIAVRPSWLDVQDILGHTNALEGCFQPAATGLYQHLIHAQEEHGRHGRTTGIYTVCLDEMNLAHVEHYFSGILQSLAGPERLRRVTCFDPAAVRADDPFRSWATVRLSPALRFVGTINLDETTKPLSQRMLDRTNLIELLPASLGDLDMSTEEGSDSALPGNAPVTQRVYQSWIRDAHPEPAQARLIDDLRPHLAALGCPLTPRRYRAMSRFVASARGLLTAEEAMDLQIAQRVLPQVRGLFSRRSREALQSMLQLLESSPLRFPESTRVLLGRQGEDLYGHEEY